ncbi:peptidoglycan-binding domain-containing protein [Streptomyces sp. NPDC026206]|uniref:peptidoglycan-binding domain-containing protein n=1 Tax=Streptomyces sp. NPDC026206 TaxID=3157089 RepID=UPI0033D0B77A
MKSSRRLAASATLVATLLVGAGALTAGTASADEVPVEGLSCGFEHKPTAVRLGSKGAAVKEAQCLLGFWGYLEVRHDPSGEFDEETESAVKEFQARRGLTAGGVVGPETWEELRRSPRTR